MEPSDIYKTKDVAQVAPKKKSSSSRRSRSRETFDEAINKDVSKTNRRRSRNSGFRHFQHLMRKPEFNKKFWTITLSVCALILILLLLWDRFLRYPNQKPEYSPNAYRTVIK